MIILRNYNIKEKMKLIFILKNLTFIILIWICYLKSDKSGFHIILLSCYYVIIYFVVQRIFGRSLENEYNVERMSFEGFNRLLAKNDIQKELRSHTQKVLLSENIMNKNMKNVSEYTSTYGQVKKGRKNDLDSYKKGYRRRYAKKNVFGKLECYCEKKVFDKIDDIDKLVEKMQNHKKRLIKNILKKHCSGIIILTSLLLIGLIIHILITGKYALIRWCTKNHDATTCEDNGTIHDTQETFDAIDIPNFLLILLSSIILISVVLYTSIKLVKYERLKMGRGK